MAAPPTSSIYPLGRLVRYARRYRPTIVVATIYSILNKLFDLAPPVLIGTAVDIVVSQEESFVAFWSVPIELLSRCSLAVP